MAEYHLLQETPEGSGNFVATGDKMETMQQAEEECATRSAQGGRYGIWVYESLRSAAAHQADHAEAQDMAAVQHAAAQALEPPAPAAPAPAEPAPVQPAPAPVPPPAAA